VGQTVAASLQAPTLYVLAADLTRMRVSASIDESAVGRVRPGQHATFRVRPTRTCGRTQVPAHAGGAGRARCVDAGRGGQAVAGNRCHAPSVD
jgi:hypothetical protein